MANGTPEIGFDPTEMVSVMGEESLGLDNLDKMAKSLAALALGVIPQLEGLKALGIGTVEIIVEGPEELAGRIPLRLSEDGRPLVRVLGKLGSELPAFRGRPCTANFDGTFFRQPIETDPVLVEDHSEVRKGQMVAWCFKTKGVQWSEDAQTSGIIHFAIEDATPVEKGKTIMYFIEEVK